MVSGGDAVQGRVAQFGVNVVLCDLFPLFAFVLGWYVIAFGCIRILYPSFCFKQLNDLNKKKKTPHGFRKNPGTRDLKNISSY